MSIVSAVGSIIRIVGLILSCIVLFVATLSIKLNTALAFFVASIIETITTAKAKEPHEYHAQRHENKSIKYLNPEKHGFIDEKQTLANFGGTKNITGLTEEALIAKAQNFLTPEILFGSKNPDVLSEDFRFIFPVVGPLSKAEFCKAFGSFQTEKAFPLDDGDSSSNYFGFNIDPIEPNRVWFFSRARFVHKGVLQFGRMKIEPSYKTIDITPQVFSVSFDREGKVYKFTGGYPVDRSAGNCGGLGGIFGIIHNIKENTLPFPEGKPWKPSLEWEIFSKRVPVIGEEWNSVLNAFK